MDGIPTSILDLTPAMLPPPGVTANFVNPPDLRVESIVVSSVSLGIAIILYSIRLFVKLFLVRQLHPEDYTCGISICIFAALSADITIAAMQGSSRHQWNLSLGQAIPIAYTSYWGEVVFCVAICFAKISVLQQIRRIFAAGQKGRMYTLCTFLIWINAGFYTAASLAGIFSCTPRPAAWDPFTTGTCINKMMLIVLSSGINVLSDICILIIPLWCVWHLKLPLKKKLALGAVFLMGIFSLGMAILKLCITIPLLTTQDLTYTINLTGLSACAETSSATLVGCLPCLPRFFQFLRNRRTDVSTEESYTNWSYKAKQNHSPHGESGKSNDSMAFLKAKFGMGVSMPGGTEFSNTRTLVGSDPSTSVIEKENEWPLSSPVMHGDQRLGPEIQSTFRPVQTLISPAQSSWLLDAGANPNIISPAPPDRPLLISRKEVPVSPMSPPQPVAPTRSKDTTSPVSSLSPPETKRGPSSATLPKLKIPQHVSQSSSTGNTSSSQNSGRRPSNPKSAQPATLRSTGPLQDSPEPLVARLQRQPPRRRSLSDIARSPTSQRTMQTLASKYWEDLEIGDWDATDMQARNHKEYMTRRDEARKKYRRQE